MCKMIVSALLIGCCATALHAEQVTLKNGDRLTGSVVSLSDKKLTLKTDYAGAVTLDWSAVVQFSSDQPMVVTNTDKQVVSGPVSTKDANLVVSTPTGTQEVPLAAVAALR